MEIARQAIIICAALSDENVLFPLIVEVLHNLRKSAELFSVGIKCFETE